MNPIDYIKVQDIILNLQNAEIEEANVIAIRDEANESLPGLEARIKYLKAELRTELNPIFAEPQQSALDFPAPVEEVPAVLIVEAPVEEEPAVEEIVADADTAMEDFEAVTEPVIEETVEEIVAEETPAQEAIEEQVIEEVVEEVIEEVVEAPVEETPEVIEEPIAEETIETPVEEEPVTEAVEAPTAADEMLAELEAEEAPVEEEPEVAFDPDNLPVTAEDIETGAVTLVEEPVTEASVEEAPVAETVAVEETVEEAPVEEEPLSLYDGDPNDGTEQVIPFGFFPMAPYDYNREFHPILASRDGLNFTYENVTLGEEDITFRMLPAQGTSGGLRFENQRHRGWRDGEYETVVSTPVMKPGMIATPLSLTSEGSEAFGYPGTVEQQFAIEMLGSGVIRFVLKNGEDSHVLAAATYPWGGKELYCTISRIEHTTKVGVEILELESGAIALEGMFDKTMLPEDVDWPLDVPMHPRIIYTVDAARWSADDPVAYDFKHFGYSTIRTNTHNPAA